ncbi:MAG: GTPase [Fluviicola sp. XM-24bin1]|nr:MAG: GTPase [Fluviicola sp. XM-24bin1]
MELYFVYNARKGLGNMVMDGLHKVVSPSTYACDLCSLTYGAVTKKKEWKAFLEQSKIPMRFYYTNTLPKEFHQNFDYPVVLRYENSSVSCILDRQDFAAINDLNEFIVLLIEKVPELSEE